MIISPRSFVSTDSGAWTRRLSTTCQPLSNSCSVSAICAVCIDPDSHQADGSGSLRSLVLAKRWVVPGDTTVSRLPILAVPLRDGCSAAAPVTYPDPRDDPGL